jgi:hypothetical protein
VKLLFLLIIFLAACGEQPEEEANTEQQEIELNYEVNTFVQEFNESAESRGDVNSIDDIQERESGEQGETQILYDSQEYQIVAMYQDDGTVLGYMMTLGTSEPYKELKGDAYNALLHTASTLKIDTDIVTESLLIATEEGGHFNYNNGYALNFTNHAGSDTMSVLFYDDN